MDGLQWRIPGTADSISGCTGRTSGTGKAEAWETMPGMRITVASGTVYGSGGWRDTDQRRTEEASGRDA